jgi:hypothetical protein
VRISIGRRKRLPHILSGSLDVIDDQEFAGAVRWLKFQAELMQRGRDARSGVTRGHGAGQSQVAAREESGGGGVGRELQMDVELLGGTGLIDNGAV